MGNHDIWKLTFLFLAVSTFQITKAQDEVNDGDDFQPSEPQEFINPYTFNDNEESVNDIPIFQEFEAPDFDAHVSDELNPQFQLLPSPLGDGESKVRDEDKLPLTFDASLIDSLKGDDSGPDNSNKLIWDIIQRLYPGSSLDSSNSLSNNDNFETEQSDVNDLVDKRSPGSSHSFVGKRGYSHAFVGKRGFSHAFVGKRGYSHAFVGKRGSSHAFVGKRVPGLTHSFVGKRTPATYMFKYPLKTESKRGAGFSHNFVGKRGYSHSFVGKRVPGFVLRGSSHNFVGKRGYSHSFVGKRGYSHSFVGKRVPGYSHNFVGKRAPGYSHSFVGKRAPGYSHNFVGKRGYSHSFVGKRTPGFSHNFVGKRVPGYSHNFVGKRAPGFSHSFVGKRAPGYSRNYIDRRGYSHAFVGKRGYSHSFVGKRAPGFSHSFVGKRAPGFSHSFVGKRAPGFSHSFVGKRSPGFSHNFVGKRDDVRDVKDDAVVDDDLFVEVEHPLDQLIVRKRSLMHGSPIPMKNQNKGEGLEIKDETANLVSKRLAEVKYKASSEDESKTKDENSNLSPTETT